MFQLKARNGEVQELKKIISQLQQPHLLADDDLDNNNIVTSAQDVSFNEGKTSAEQQRKHLEHISEDMVQKVSQVANLEKLVESLRLENTQFEKTLSPVIYQLSVLSLCMYDYG